MFKIMKKTSIAALAAITLAGTVSAPAYAQYARSNNYQSSQRHNNNTGDVIVGGAIGALLGGVVGSKIAGAA